MLGIPVDELMGRISSRRFVDYRAFKRRNTWAPDVWFSALRGALVARGGDVGRFVPVDDDEADARIDRDADAAEAALDAGL